MASTSSSNFFILALSFPLLLGFESSTALGQQFDKPFVKDPQVLGFASQVRPLLDEYCMGCHDADNMESGIRVDNLTGELKGRSPFLWENIRKQISDGKMPPEDEAQLTDEERQKFTAWIDAALLSAKRRSHAKNGSVRRLTVAQYQNTLSDLLGIEDDFTSLLPPDSVSKDGFLNNEQAMVLSPLLIEAYFDVADRALDRCIVDDQAKPVIQNFKVELGKSLNALPCPDPLILGANSDLLDNRDFVVTQLRAKKPFEFYPFWMKTKQRYIEGYEGNSTVRGWKNYDSIYHSVFACMRGSTGYPKGNASDVVPGGLLLRPAIPSSELFGQSSTYGPQANFKISLRELPDHGRFRVTVRAAKYDDGLLLEPNAPLVTSESSLTADLSASREASFQIESSGVYQVDVTTGAQKADSAKEPQLFSLTLGDRFFGAKLKVRDAEEVDQVTTPFLQVRLFEGPLRVTAKHGDNSQLQTLKLTRLDENSPAITAFAKFEKRSPTLGVHLGLRRDCGSTLTQVRRRYRVGNTELAGFVFEGAINNFPRPEVEKDNVNYLAGVREIGVRSEYTDGRDMPRMRIRSVEFEGPLYESWPPATHRSIFIDSENASENEVYAKEIIRSFASRAYRRPVAEDELATLLAVWETSFEESANFRASIKDALLVVLTSPQFLFLIENSENADAEQIDEYELASKLSFFLWDSPPDSDLQALALGGELRSSLGMQVKTMLQDARFEQFAQQFASQWLGLHKLSEVEFDRKKYPALTRDAKTQLRKEPIALLRYLIQENRPLEELIQSDFLMANEVVASYYDLGEQVESGFDFVPVKHDDEHLGGVLSQAAILAGLSDGRESNPVKRGAWLARKLVAEPPDDPPPNVPELTADDESLSLRERLELHRNQPGCVKCHEGIDPWGLPLEEFDAGGRYKSKQKVDASSTLPDKSRIQDANGLKEYLAKDRIDQVAFSFLKHVTTYAIGRELSYNEIEFLREAGLQLKADGYRMQDLILFVVNSPMFLEK